MSKAIYEPIAEGLQEALALVKSGQPEKRLRPVYEREEHDFYQEPEYVTKALLEVERPFIGDVLDPCCGKGNVWRALKYSESAQLGLSYPLASDLVDRGMDAYIGDFRHTIPMWADDSRRDALIAWQLGARPPGGLCSIVTNPPFKDAQELIELALKHVHDRVCCFLPLTFLEGKRRSVWLESTPLARVWRCRGRVTCQPGRLLGEPIKSSGTKAYAWFVWEKGWRGPDQGGWLPEMGEKK